MAVFLPLSGVLVVGEKTETRCLSSYRCLEVSCGEKQGQDQPLSSSSPRRRFSSSSNRSRGGNLPIAGPVGLLLGGPLLGGLLLGGLLLGGLLLGGLILGEVFMGGLLLSELLLPALPLGELLLG